jgi:hypothetical protein
MGLPSLSQLRVLQPGEARLRQELKEFSHSSFHALLESFGREELTK